MFSPMLRTPLMIQKMNNRNEALNDKYAAEATDFLLGEIEKNLRDMLRLAKWAADTDLTNRQRRVLQKEIDRLKNEIDNTFNMLTGPPTLIN